MKKILVMLLIVGMLFTVAGCGNADKPADETTTEATTEATNDSTVSTVGQTLLADFKTKADGTAQEIADGLLQNSVIGFMGASMPVEPGLLTGFDNTEITGFKEGVMFAPAIGTIPFVGYIFTLEDGADVDAFKATLKDNANLRWNICTEAEELIVESEGNTVFFLMCPASFEEPEAEGDMGADVGGMDMAGGMEVPAEDGIALE